jgi:hypothetical protein
LAFRQACFSALQGLERSSRGPFGSANHSATVTQHVEMVELIGDRS